MKLFFAIGYIRIITLTMIFDDHPLVEYPLFDYIYNIFLFFIDNGYPVFNILLSDILFYRNIYLLFFWESTISQEIGKGFVPLFLICLLRLLL